MRSPTLLSDQDERRRDERLESDRRLDAAHGRAEIVDDGRDRHVHQRGVDDEHEHRHREQQCEPLVEGGLFGGVGRSLAHPRDPHPPASTERITETRAEGSATRAATPWGARRHGAIRTAILLQLRSVRPMSSSPSHQPPARELAPARTSRRGPARARGGVAGRRRCASSGRRAPRPSARGPTPAGSSTGSSPIFVQLLRKMSAKLGAMTALNPCVLDRPRRVLAARAAAEVRPGEQDRSRPRTADR